MVFSKLKAKNIQKEYERLVQQNREREKSLLPIQSAAILTTETLSFEFDLQEKVRKYLNVRNSRIYSYRPYEKGMMSSYKHFTENDINWQGKVTDVSFKSFIEHPFDLLICFFDQNHPYLEYAAAISAAGFKIGFSKVNSDLFEIEISEKTANADAFFAVAQRYLTILNKLTEPQKLNRANESV